MYNNLNLYHNTAIHTNIIIQLRDSPFEAQKKPVQSYTNRIKTAVTPQQCMQRKNPETTVSGFLCVRMRRPIIGNKSLFLVYAQQRVALTNGHFKI